MSNRRYTSVIHTKNGDKYVKDAENREILANHIAEVTQALKDRYTKAETYNKTELNGLVDTPHQKYVTVATYASLPAEGNTDTIYRVSSYDGANSQVDNTVYSEYAWNGTQYVFLCVKAQTGEVFDISVYNNNATYADLAAALGVDGANVPASVRKGGMSVKFVQSSDNKYVQYRLMATTWSTSETDWQGVDEEPTAGSDNLVTSGGIAEQFDSVLDILSNEVPHREVQTTYSSGQIKSDGTIGSSSYAKHSDFVQVSQGINYSLYTKSSSGWCVAFYSSANEESLIGCTPLGEYETFDTIPISILSGANYIKVSLPTDTRAKFYEEGYKRINYCVGDKIDEINTSIQNLSHDSSITNANVDSIKNILEESFTNEVQTTYSSGPIKSDGTIGSSTSAVHSDFVEIVNGFSYSLYTKSTNSWCVAFYSDASEDSFLSATSLGNNTTITTINIVIPENAVYMRISLSSVDGKFYYSGTRLMTDNVPEKLNDIEEGMSDLEEQIGTLNPPSIYYVRPVGSSELPAANYNSITDALVDLKDDDSPKIIYIEAGTYDGFAEMGGQTYIDSIPTDPYPTSSDWRTYTKAIIPPNTQLIGLGMVTINFSLPANTDSHIVAILSPLAIKGGNVTIENITINGENCRYCIHDENGPNVHESTKIYRNVRLYMNTAGWEQSYGAGHGKNGNLLFENCIFSSYGLPWSVHDNSQMDNTTIIINSCVFLSSDSTKASLRFGTTDANNGVKRVMINNCTFGTNKILLDTSNEKDNHYELTILHSGNPTVTAPEDNDYPPIIYQ